MIPQEVIERDYGCGDPEQFICEKTKRSSTSGAARERSASSPRKSSARRKRDRDRHDGRNARSRPDASAHRGGADRLQNVEFRKGRIQDLALDLEKLDTELKARPITDAASFLRADELAQELRIKHPLVATESVDVVVSSCVLNLVEPKSKRQFFEEIFRVLQKVAER